MICPELQSWSIGTTFAAIGAAQRLRSRFMGALGLWIRPGHSFCVVILMPLAATELCVEVNYHTSLRQCLLCRLFAQVSHYLWKSSGQAGLNVCREVTIWKLIGLQNLSAVREILDFGISSVRLQIGSEEVVLHFKPDTKSAEKQATRGNQIRTLSGDIFSDSDAGPDSAGIREAEPPISILENIYQRL